MASSSSVSTADTVTAFDHQDSVKMEDICFTTPAEVQKKQRRPRKTSNAQKSLSRKKPQEVIVKIPTRLSKFLKSRSVDRQLKSSNPGVQEGILERRLKKKRAKLIKKALKQCEIVRQELEIKRHQASLCSNSSAANVNSGKKNAGAENCITS